MYIAYAATASASNAAASLGARLFEALVIMIIGMSAVFLMLTISMFGMMLIGKVASPKTEPQEEASPVIPSTSSVAGLESSSEDTDAEVAAAIAVIHHIRRKSVVSIPIIKRKDI